MMSTDDVVKQIKDNPKIVNYIHTPQVNWAIINTKIINQNSKKFILLNYPGSKFKKNLIKNNNNLLELNDLDFLLNKFNEIESLEILNKIPISGAIIATPQGMAIAINEIISSRSWTFSVSS